MSQIQYLHVTNIPLCSTNTCSYTVSVHRSNCVTATSFVTLRPHVMCGRSSANASSGCSCLTLHMTHVTCDLFWFGRHSHCLLNKRIAWQSSEDVTPCRWASNSRRFERMYYYSSKRREVFSQRHGVTLQKTGNFIATAVMPHTSNFKFCLCMCRMGKRYLVGHLE